MPRFRLCSDLDRRCFLAGVCPVEWVRKAADRADLNWRSESFLQSVDMGVDGHLPRNRPYIVDGVQNEVSVRLKS